MNARAHGGTWGSPPTNRAAGLHLATSDPTPPVATYTAPLPLAPRGGRTCSDRLPRCMALSTRGPGTRRPTRESSRLMLLRPHTPLKPRRPRNGGHDGGHDGGRVSGRGACTHHGGRLEAEPRRLHAPRLVAVAVLAAALVGVFPVRRRVSVAPRAAEQAAVRAPQQREQPTGAPARRRARERTRAGRQHRGTTCTIRTRLGDTKHL